jgi:flagellar assembly factor FliW
VVDNDAVNRIPVKTSHGVRYVSKNDIIHFPEGILAFGEYTDFVIFDIKGCEPFKSMLSVKEGGPDFVVVETMSIFDNYSPLDSFSSLEEMDIGCPVELVVLSLVTLAEDPKDITVNLRGPVFLNLSTNLAMQVVLPDERYSTREPVIFKE